MILKEISCHLDVSERLYATYGTVVEYATDEILGSAYLAIEAVEPLHVNTAVDDSPLAASPVQSLTKASESLRRSL